MSDEGTPPSETGPPASGLEAIRRLYADLPDLACKGLCTESCGPVPLSKAERDALVERHGPLRDLQPTSACGYLNIEGRCDVYEDRPLICRLFGIVDHPEMRCPFGCVPERFLTNEEGHELLRAVQQAGGGMTSMGRTAAAAMAAINLIRKERQ